MAVKTSDLVHFLKTKTVSAGILDRLKITYRPFICPFDELLTLVKPGANVLDIGCGAGQFLTLVAAFTEANNLAGLEISPKLIQQAEALLKPYQVQHKIWLETYNGIKFPDFLAAFDNIFLIDVLHHVPAKNQELFLKNIYQEMAPNTTLILKDIDAASPWVYFNKLHDLVLAQEIGNELSIVQAKKLVTEIGFEILLISAKQMFGYPHYTLILKK